VEKLSGEAAERSAAADAAALASRAATERAEAAEGRARQLEKEANGLAADVAALQARPLGRGLLLGALPAPEGLAASSTHAYRRACVSIRPFPPSPLPLAAKERLGRGELVRGGGVRVLHLRHNPEANAQQVPASNRRLAVPAPAQRSPLPLAARRVTPAACPSPKQARGWLACWLLSCLFLACSFLFFLDCLRVLSARLLCLAAPPGRARGGGGAAERGEHVPQSAAGGAGGAAGGRRGRG
jgi:hypothetical protein